MLSLMSWLQLLMVKVLRKQTSLYVFRDVLEVCILKNPMPLGMGVSGPGLNVMFPHDQGIFLIISIELLPYAFFDKSIFLV